MIICKLDDLIWQNKTTAKDIHEKTGLSESTLSDLRSNLTKGYEARTINLICKYFNCKVGDLLEYVPD